MSRLFAARKLIAGRKLRTPKPFCGSRSRSGQSVVEFTMILPVIMFLFLGMVEMGFAINHNVGIQTAARQGARVGSIMVNGDTKCGTGDAAKAATVDPAIVAAVQGALTSPGSMVNVSQVTEIDIFGITQKGVSLGQDVWKWSTATSSFYSFSTGWAAVGRCGAVTGTLANDGGAPRVGVRILYNYKFATPLGGIISAFSSGQISMSAQESMALEPPKP